MDTPEALTALRDLVDKEAIRDLARRYAHHVWQLEVDALVDLFAEDGEMDTSLEEPIRGGERLCGRPFNAWSTTTRRTSNPSSTTT